MVGWVTPQASAARPKCRSFASASRSSSLSIKEMAPENAVAKAVAQWPEIARTGGHQYVKSGVRRARFQGQSDSRIASFSSLISVTTTGLRG
jgi:hypothetical protein